MRCIQLAAPRPAASSFHSALRECLEVLLRFFEGGLLVDLANRLELRNHCFVHVRLEVPRVQGA